MAEQFKEQGGAATMDPNAAVRWATSKLMTQICNPQRQTKIRAQVEKNRLKSGKEHIVEYFHQAQDGYSHLAAQVLQSLSERYNIQLVCHLVSGPQGKNSAEPERLLQLSRYDSFHVAPEYGLSFPLHKEELRENLVQVASGILSALDSQAFIDHAAEIGDALWRDDEASLNSLAEQLGCNPPEAVKERLDAGNARREELNHYSGGMFFYGDEWYWGVDRLYHLEQRLAELGIDRRPGTSLIVPRPEVEPGERVDDGSLTLEIYPSLRSPYTAISFDRAVKLARDTGVNLQVRPVLPMVMRGVPATRQKGMYIFRDTAREARAAGVTFGNFYDPIGEPARRGYSLYPWASEQGKGAALISAFLSCAFTKGININRDKGLKKVVELAGLDWSQAQKIVGQAGWENLLEDNRKEMYASGLWGVPSFRLLDKSGKVLLALWGQDRLWLFAREIQRQLAARA
ncbi:MAG: DsbA family protein [Halioglobus sp.]|nr:DsbA family protein [Halioglobus sp.]